MNDHRIERLATGTIYTLALLATWFFLPISPDVVELSKRLILFVAAFFFAVLWSIQTIREKHVRLTLTPFTLPTLGLVVATIASSFLATPYPREGLLNAGIFYGSVCILLLLAPGLARPKPSVVLKYVNLGGAILVVSALLQLLGVGPTKLLSQVFSIFMSESPAFSLTGSMYVAFGILIALAITNIVWLISAKNAQTKTMSTVWLTCSLLGVVLHAYILFWRVPNQLVLTPFQASWSVAMDMLKTPRTALLGAGPSSYSVAFSQFRPASLNISPVWNFRFALGRTEPFHLLTTLGIIGFVAWLGVANAALRMGSASRKHAPTLTAFTVGLLLLQLTLPPSTAVWILMCVMAITMSATLRGNPLTKVRDMLFGLIAGEPRNALTPLSQSQAFFPVLSVVVLLSICGFSAWQVGRTVYGEQLLLESAQAASRNNALAVFEKQRTLVQFDNTNDATQRMFATTNFLIAKNISQQKEISDQDRQNLPLLIQQSVASAKRATELDPRKTENWETLASIYEQLIGTATGANEYAIAAYVRAIQSEPTNPSLRMALGGVYARLNNPEQAKVLFQQTIELKPDWANAYYNLATIQKGQKNFPAALEALLSAQKFLPADSADRAQVDKEVNELTAQVKKLQEEQQVIQAQNAVKPGAKPASSATPTNGQIKIPEDLGLPKEEAPLTLPEGPKQVSTTPKPMVTSTPSPSPSSTPSTGTQE